MGAMGGPERSGQGWRSPSARLSQGNSTVAAPCLPAAAQGGGNANTSLLFSSLPCPDPRLAFPATVPSPGRCGTASPSRQPGGTEQAAAGKERPLPPSCWVRPCPRGCRPTRVMVWDRSPWLEPPVPSRPRHHRGLQPRSVDPSAPPALSEPGAGAGWDMRHCRPRDIKPLQALGGSLSSCLCSALR